MENCCIWLVIYLNSLSYLTHFFLDCEMFRTNVENIKTNILCSVTFFPPENIAVCEKVRKSIIKRGRPQMTIRRMRVACWIPKTTNTHTQVV